MPKFLNFVINLILKQYFESERCIFLLTDQEFSINAIGTNIPIVILRDINATFSYDLLFSNFGCQGILLHVERPHLTFHELERQFRLHIDRFNQRKYLILPTLEAPGIITNFSGPTLTYVSDILVVVLEKISKGLSSKEKQNVILDTINEFYSFYTHKYIGNYHNNELVLLHSWNFNSSELFFDLDNLYPDKLNNQMGRPLRIATFTYLPYSIPSKTYVFILIFILFKFIKIFLQKRRMV